MLPFDVVDTATRKMNLAVLPTDLLFDEERLAFPLSRNRERGRGEGRGEGRGKVKL